MAFASKEFSISSFTTSAGDSITSPAAIFRLTSGGRSLTNIRIKYKDRLRRYQIYLRSYLLEDFFGNLNGTASYRFIRGYFEQAKSLDRINQQNFVDLKTYLVDDILVKVDRMSMATSLEARVPFLDHRVVELSFRIPGGEKIRGGDTKVILKRAMKDLLPEEILHRDKQGFSIPIKNWIRNELRSMMLDVLDEHKIRNQGLFDYRTVNRLVDEHLRGVENHSHRLWALMMFELWHDKFAN